MKKGKIFTLSFLLSFGLLNLLLTKVADQEAIQKDALEGEKSKLYSLDTENQCKIDQTKTQENTKDVLFIGCNDFN